MNSPPRHGLTNVVGEDLEFLKYEGLLYRASHATTTKEESPREGTRREATTYRGAIYEAMHQISHSLDGSGMSSPYISFTSTAATAVARAVQHTINLWIACPSIGIDFSSDDRRKKMELVEDEDIPSQAVESDRERSRNNFPTYDLKTHKKYVERWGESLSEVVVPRSQLNTCPIIIIPAETILKDKNAQYIGYVSMYLYESERIYDKLFDCDREKLNQLATKWVKDTIKELRLESIYTRCGLRQKITKSVETTRACR